MCLITFAFQHLEQFPLMVIANRDEFYARPTAPLHWWDAENQTIIGGRDLQDGGTWMGMSAKGRFAALTNYRAPEYMQGGKPSRGALVTMCLQDNMPLEEIHRFLKTRSNQYNGFNLVYGSREEMFYYNNVQDKHQQLYPGIYGLSNAYLNTPWPKVLKAKKAFTEQMQNRDAENTLLTLMQNDETAPDSELPNTGVPLEWEKKLSAMFITSTEYGTRLTTFVSIDRNGNVVYREKGYQPVSDHRITFNIIA